eukprot:2975585-Prymnesium_polylepis.1
MLVRTQLRYVPARTLSSSPYLQTFRVADPRIPVYVRLYSVVRAAIRFICLQCDTTPPITCWRCLGTRSHHFVCIGDSRSEPCARSSLYGG